MSSRYAPLSSMAADLEEEPKFSSAVSGAYGYESMEGPFHGVA
jgi:hypothetical protein